MLSRKITIATLIALGLAGAHAGTAFAGEDKSSDPPELYRKLANCRTIADATQRLACFDAASAELDAAVSRKDVYMVDKQQVQKTRRTLFGLPLPDLGLFGGDKDGDDAGAISQIESTISAVRSRGVDLLITIAEGSTWLQQEGTMAAISPKPGMSVTIKRGALGSYWLKVGNQPATKVRRII
jgi:hypothetical protein